MMVKAKVTLYECRAHWWKCPECSTINDELYDYDEGVVVCHHCGEKYEGEESI